MAIVIGHHAEIYFEDHHVTDALKRPLNYESSWVGEIKREEKDKMYHTHQRRTNANIGECLTNMWDINNEHNETSNLHYT